MFPAMTDAEFKELRASIKANGLEFPIVVYKNQILDGRHRYHACLAEKVEPWTVKHDGDDSPEALAAYVYRANAIRRHLSTSQRAMIAAEMCNLPVGKPTNVIPSKEGISAATAAKTVGVSVASIERARHVIDNAAPEVTQAVQAGTVAVTDAAAVAALPKKEQQAALAAVESGVATTLAAAVKHKPPKEKKEPHERNGQQAKDPREFERLRQDIGRLAPRFDKLNDQSPAAKFNRDAQAKVNDLLHILADWRKATR